MVIMKIQEIIDKLEQDLIKAKADLYKQEHNGQFQDIWDTFGQEGYRTKIKVIEGQIKILKEITL